MLLLITTKIEAVEGDAAEDTALVRWVQLGDQDAFRTFHTQAYTTAALKGISGEER